MNQMTSIVLPVILIFSLTLCGCESTQPMNNQDSPQLTQSQSFTEPIDRKADTRVVILDENLRLNVVVHTPTLFRSGRGPLRIEVPIAYMGEKNCPIEYRFRFFGFTGLDATADTSEEEEEVSWKKTRLEAMAFTHIKGTAPDSSAQNFRLEIKKAE